MSDTQYTRRDLLRTGAGAAGAAALAGCGDMIGGNGNGGDDPAQQVVPAQATMAGFVDLQGMVDDGNLRSIGDAFLGELATMEGYDGPETVEEAISQAEEEAQQSSDSSELGSDTLESMTFFTDVEAVDQEDPYAGAVISLSISESEFQDLLDQNAEDYDEDEYNGITIYSNVDEVSDQAGMSGSDAVVAWLGDGQMAAATRPVVEDIIDVFQGDADGMSGDLESHYDGVSEGYLRFATKVPEGTFPENSGQQGGVGPDWEPFQEIEYISGNFVSGGSTVSLNIRHHTTGSEAASNVSEEVDNLLGTLQMAFGQNELASNLLEAVSVETDGSTVITAFEDEVEALEGYAEEAASFLMSGGVGMGAGA